MKTEQQIKEKLEHIIPKEQPNIWSRASGFGVQNEAWIEALEWVLDEKVKS